MTGRPRRSRRFLAVLTALGIGVGTLAVVGGESLPAGVASSTLPRPEGAGPPVAASGMGTQAALDNPRCQEKSPGGEELASGYGRFSSTSVGGGPVCVKEWKSGADNGGATHTGVTKDKVTIVAVLPNEQQLQSDPVKPTFRATKEPSTYENAIHDYLMSVMKFYETWGRDIEVKFLTSTGEDEAAQRADAVTVKAMKPFAVFDVTVKGLDVVEQELAKAKIPVMGFSTTASKATVKAPYRWGLSDAESSAINSAEVIGKQLVGKKAEYGGDDVKGQTREFGVVYIDTLIDYPQFKSFFKKYGGTVTSENSYKANGSTFGDPAVSNEVAPTLAACMKSAGVTTVILLSDTSMNNALMNEATKLEWFPEWFFTGSVYSDIGILVRLQPKEQTVHAFGISFLTPYVDLDETTIPELPPTSGNTINWYYGLDAGTYTGSVVTPIGWVLTGIHTAGPKLTPKTFAQGLFAIPASGGAAQNRTTSTLSGFGKNPGLPYDEYASNGLDFAPYWWDPETTGPSNGQGEMGKGVGWYANGAKRYKSDTWPKKQFDWFDKDTSVNVYTVRQTEAPTYAGACQGCPAAGGPGQTGAGKEGFIAKAYGEGEASL